MIMKDPELRTIVNPYWRAQETLKHGAFEEAEIKVAMSREEVGNIEILAEATQAIQDIVQGQNPKVNRGANTAFIQKILDFATDEDVDDNVFKRLTDYAKAHIPVAYENAMRKANLVKAGMGVKVGQTERPGMKISEGMETQEPMAGTPQTISSGIKSSNILQGKPPMPV